MKMFKWLLEADEDASGTYVGVKLSEESAAQVKEFMRNNSIPVPLPKSKLHVTVIYSRKELPDFKPKGKLEDPIVVVPEKFALFGESKNALVVKIKSPDLVKRHKEIMKEHNATFDYDVYEPHISLSYDCVGFDVSSLDLEELGPLEIVEEYEEEITLGRE